MREEPGDWRRNSKPTEPTHDRNGALQETALFLGLAEGSVRPLCFFSSEIKGVRKDGRGLTSTPEEPKRPAKAGMSGCRQVWHAVLSNGDKREARVRCG